jgi:ribosome maturation factor RimP
MEINKLREIAETGIKNTALLDCFVVDVVLSGRKIEIYIDSDEGVDFQKCKKLSRFLEAYLDESEEFSDNYVLEVSSPGLDRPLLMPRQYKKNIGRLLRLEAKKFENPLDCRLLEVKEEGVLVEYTVILKEDRKKKKVTVKDEVSWDEIVKVTVQAEF